MRDETEYVRWLDASGASLRLVALTTEAGEHAAACFHAEQAAQQGLKGLLHGLGAGERAFGHGLVALMRVVEDYVGIQVSQELDDAAARLARHYIPTRYPDALPDGLIGDHYRRSDADLARADAEVLCDFFADLWAEAHEAESETAEAGGTPAGEQEPHE